MANIQPLRDFGCAEPIGFELLHLGLIKRRLPTPVDDCRIGLGDTLKLALAPQVGFELGEDAQHIKVRPFCGNQAARGASCRRASLMYGTSGAQSATPA